MKQIFTSNVHFKNKIKENGHFLYFIEISIEKIASYQVWKTFFMKKWTIFKFTITC